MEFVDGPVALGEWTPDSDLLRFPNLAGADNVEPVNTVYKSFDPLVDTGGPVVPGGFIRGFGQSIFNNVVYTYAGTDDGIFESFGGGAFTARSATMSPAQYDFLQFDDLQIVAPSALSPRYRTLGSASNFATLGSTSGSAPAASRLGKINKFLIVGNTSSADYHMQWSGINQPLSWPTPNSATATAQQSGEQYLDAEYGEITGFSNGDQHGLVFQRGAITRITYVGPPVVFQFDKISDKYGCAYPRSIVQVGNLTYFISSAGFCVTDGVTVKEIGLNKCSKFFLSASVNGAKERVYGAHNRYKNLVYWTYCNDSDSESRPNKMILYNNLEDRFSSATQSLEGILGTNGIDSAVAPNIRGFGVNNTLGSFSSAGASSQNAEFQTGDIEFNPGGRSFVSGVKLVADQTANGMYCQMLTRDQLVTASQTTGATTIPNSSTLFADVRSDARYHAIRFGIQGVFDEARALEFMVQPSGRR
jgi:hypothetical protein